MQEVREADVQAPVEELARRLVECLDENTEVGAPGEDEIILEIEIGGVRYLLVRACSPHARPGVQLSPREKEVVRLVSKGHSDRTIAAVLDISRWTVSTHVRRVLPGWLLVRGPRWSHGPSKMDCWSQSSRSLSNSP